MAQSERAGTDFVGRFMNQFSGPHGWLGRVAGMLMARKNGPLNAWIVEQLELRPESRVLEIGFGPGLAVELAAAQAVRGRVAGLDKSAEMLAQARRRNRAAVRAGRVDLRLGSAERLPFGDGSFSHACAVNSLQFWPDAAAALRELQRVLEPGGRLVLGQRLRREGGGRTDRRRYGMTDERLGELGRMLEWAGFELQKVERREIGEETIAALVALRRAGGL